MQSDTVIKPIIPSHSPHKIFYGLVETDKYGQLFLAHYLEKNLCICYAHFTNGENMEKFTHDLQKLWPESELQHNDEITKKVWDKIISQQIGVNEDIYVALNGTDFQNKVWSALLEIPFGEERTYGELAVKIGNPKAVRAVGSAIGSNNIAIFIPCHRVKAKTGDLHKYRWGDDLKKKILLNEQANK